VSLLPANHRTEREVENGFRQFDKCLELVTYYLDPERPFALRPFLIDELQRDAVEGIETEAGRTRRTAVGLTHSKHDPPEPHLVEGLVRDFCEYINSNWHERNAFHLAAYAMWRLNWIHPYTDGNGRTSRIVSYLILCLKVGYQLPGAPTIPQQIEEDKTHYTGQSGEEVGDKTDLN
jgi:Fic family protein